MANPLVLSFQEARSIAFQASFGGAAKADSVSLADSVWKAAGTLGCLGYVQIDTISVVERAHHHVLWSRDRDYRPSVLPALETEPRQAFEYWAHAAAYLPLSDYRYCLPRMRRIAAEGHDWFPSDQRVVDWVRDRIRAEGPLRSQDFESDGARGPWWDWKPAKAALEFLFQSGELMVVGRPGFQKLYDLTERVIPQGTDTTFPTEQEMGDWYVGRAASALGVFTLRDLAYQRKDGTKGIAGALERACETGSLRPCVVRESVVKESSADAGVHVGMDGGAPSTDRDNANGKPLESWCNSALLSRFVDYGEAEPGNGNSGVRESGAWDGRPVRILSPFDNLIIDRKRAKRIFGLEYTLECYVPAAKRKFGYFALPVFHQGRPVGLIDCKADRKNRVLLVNRVCFDWGADSAGGPEGFVGGFETELASFAAFNSCDLTR